MGSTYMEADLAAAWDSGYWKGTGHEGPLHGAAVDARNPYKQHAEAVQRSTPAKACKVALKTEEGRDASPKSVTAEEPTND